MPRFITTALACLALVPAGALVAGCGSDDETASTSTPAAEPAPAPAETTGEDDGGESGGEMAAVSMKNSKMVPEAIAVKVDQKIEWTNDDGYDHNVTATEGADFASGNMPAGAKFDYTPEKAGKIDYVCTIHSGQNGTITVSE